MRRQNWITRDVFNLLAFGIASSFMLEGCYHPTEVAATVLVSAPPTSLPSESSLLSEIPSPSATSTSTSFPSETPASEDTFSFSITPIYTATPLIEKVGVVILNGQEIGTIQKSGKNFQYVANPDTLTPEVNGKVVLKVKDPQEMWGFNLESSSSPMYRLKDDPRSGWEAYAVLMAYRGSYEITVKFIAINVQTEERIKGKVNIEVVGVTPLATDTPEIGWYPAP